MTNRRIYNIDYKRFAVLTIPIKMRRDGIKALLSAFLEPLSELQRNFVGFLNSIETSIHSQVCYMEAALNDRYDYYQRRIFIRDAEVNDDEFFLFDEGTGKATMFSDENGNPIWWVDNGRLGSTAPDFEVVFPAGFSFSDDEVKQLRQFINSNKLASKQYRFTYE